MAAHINPSPLNLTYKLLYDPETGIILGTSSEKVEDVAWLEITFEEYQKHTHTPDPSLRVKEMKIVQHERSSVVKKRIVDGDQVFTDSTNMLLIRNERHKKRKGRKIAD